MGKRSQSKEGRMRSMNKMDCQVPEEEKRQVDRSDRSADTQIGKLKAQPVSFESVSESISDTDL